MTYRTNKSRKIGFAVSLFIALAVVTVFTVTYYMGGAPVSLLEASLHPSTFIQKKGETISDKNSMKVMTLNIGHGRKLGPNQIFQPSASIEANLDDIARVLRRERPDVIALQEADGPSIWSGDFDHVQYLAESAAYPYSVRGEHVNGMRLSYGTALLSASPLEDAFSITFAPSPPTFPKGFVACTKDWPGASGLKIDVVSVHLDFSRKSVRIKQVEEIIEKFSPRERPMIMMGDFNCHWKDKNSSLRMLAEQLNLKTHKPEAGSLHTFTRLKKRIDWILVSPDIDFSNYKVLPDTLSDHYAVVCDLKLVN
jgi:endonuclease/exonuclease/phosphatase family metal-dependent hydrolase